MAKIIFAAAIRENENSFKITYGIRRKEHFAADWDVNSVLGASFLSWLTNIIRSIGWRSCDQNIGFDHVSFGLSKMLVNMKYGKKTVSRWRREMKEVPFSSRRGDMESGWNALDEEDSF